MFGQDIRPNPYFFLNKRLLAEGCTPDITSEIR
jgi:hypothetical protein